MKRGVIFNIQGFSLQDGPGIRTTVFFKGCPLRCPWCSNPESQNSFPEIALNDTLCNKCGDCIKVCNEQAISLSKDGVRIRRESCVMHCAKCIDVCGPGALRVYGKEMTLEEVLQKVIRDKTFYQTSGGGVTAGGGEPLMQSEFVEALFKQCRKEEIHTCLDTSGYAPSIALEKVLNYTNLVLFDLKLIDPLSHRSLIRKSNQFILQNARIVASRRIPVIFRIPLIPGITDSDENLTGIVAFLKTLDLNGEIEIGLVPYHKYGIGKYDMLDRSYRIAGLTPLEEEQIQSRKALIESFGVMCKIV
jgi:pyruvate formate lyase activating enzyme